VSRLCCLRRSWTRSQRPIEEEKVPMRVEQRVAIMKVFWGCVRDAGYAGGRGRGWSNGYLEVFLLDHIGIVHVGDRVIQVAGE
jgi:hypothetical protein